MYTLFTETVEKILEFCMPLICQEKQLVLFHRCYGLENQKATSFSAD